MDKPERMDDEECTDKGLGDEQETPDRLVEIQVQELEVVSGGGDGTALGIGKN